MLLALTPGISARISDMNQRIARIVALYAVMKAMIAVMIFSPSLNGKAKTVLGQLITTDAMHPGKEMTH
jgi:hypothetical protein